MATEQKEKSELVATDKEVIMDLLKIQRKYITPNGTELMVESKAHLKYITHLEGIAPVTITR